jgi:uncharacterized protein YukE
MSEYIHLVEQEIAKVAGYIERYKRCGVYHDNCEVWRHHLTAYQRILDLMTAEVDHAKHAVEQLRLAA